MLRVRETGRPSPCRSHRIWKGSDRTGCTKAWRFCPFAESTTRKLTPIGQITFNQKYHLTKGVIWTKNFVVTMDSNQGRDLRMMNKWLDLEDLSGIQSLKQPNPGISVSTFTVAVDRDRKEPDGSRKADFIDVVAWNEKKPS